MQYLIAINDLHNFFVPIDFYKKVIRKEYFELKIPTEPIDINNPYGAKHPVPIYINQRERLGARDTADGWADKNYPDTCTENIKILDDYLTLCEQNKIRPIMFLPPMTEGYIKHFSKQILDEFYYIVGQACKKHPYAIFIDGWKLQGMTDKDFYDVFHLNIIGAAKFSTFLNSVIEQLDRQ